MRVLIASDSFKGCLPAAAVCQAIAAGLHAADSAIEVDLCPVADGGEGTVAAMLCARGGSSHEASVSDPLGRPLTAAWGMTNDATAIVELAAASGIERLRPEERDPLRASTRGTGELVVAAIDAGATSLLVGLGGSATVDGGAGILSALGARLLDARGREIGDGGGALSALVDIDISAMPRSPSGFCVRVICDVSNPLLGPEGAAVVFAPQKGAAAADIERLELGLTTYAEVITRVFGQALGDLPGCGAAGGAAIPFICAFDATLEPGAAVIADALHLRRRMAKADLVITGEGRLDRQSLHGKVPVHVADLARAQGVPVIAVAGDVDAAVRGELATRFDRVIALTEHAASPEDAIRDAAALLQRTAQSLV